MFIKKIWRMLNFLNYFYMPWFRFSLRLQLLDGVVSMYACFLNHLKRFTKLAKDADGSVEMLISYYHLVTVSLWPDQVFPLADTTVNPSSSVWFTSLKNSKPFNTFCVSFKNDAIQKTPWGRKWQVYQMIYWSTSWHAKIWST